MTPKEFNEFNQLKSKRLQLLQRVVDLHAVTTKEAKKEQLQIYRDLKKIGARLYELSGKSSYIA